MSAVIDLTGQEFGRLTVIERVETRGKSKQATWRCKCSCGNEKSIVGYSLRCGQTQSCGCLRREHMRDATTTHGMSGTRLFSIWTGMKTRCENSRDEVYLKYGARGVTVCEEWHNFESFMEWALANGYRDDLTIDRIKNELGYFPENCRWVDMVTQQNNRRNNTILEINGERHTAAEWGRIAEHNNGQAIISRIKNGWEEKDLLKPLGYKRGLIKQEAPTP